MSIGRMV